MRVLLLGSGAREHALAARLAAEPGVDTLLCAPGNPGMAGCAATVAADLARPTSLTALAERERIDFTIVGPELPLSVGVVDAFTAQGRMIFGPTAAAARLESSKAFAKAFMARHNVPTARFRISRTRDEAIAVVESGDFGWPVVLKADGLAAGKGVVIADNAIDANHAITAAMTDRRFGAAGTTLVVEECLTGPEVSFFVISDGERALPIGTAQDHKRIFDGDRGPNTGGMGAFAPSPLVDAAVASRVMREIVAPVIAGMAAEGHPFRGFLYVGLMLTADGPKVIEFNARLGDPEAQVILPRIAEPLLPVLRQAAAGRLHQQTLVVVESKFACVVLASRGYPDATDAGQPITGLADAERVSGVRVYHAGTAVRDGELVTAGGRVLSVVGEGDSYAEAIARAYAAVYQISFDGMHFRRDIGRRALQAL